MHPDIVGVGNAVAEVIVLAVVASDQDLRATGAKSLMRGVLKGSCPLLQAQGQGFVPRPLIGSP